MSCCCQNPTEAKQPVRQQIVSSREQEEVALALFPFCLTIFSPEQEVIFFCVREEPVVFLRKDEDFVPYTPRRKENLHENLHGLNKEEPVESLELTVRKEVSKAEQQER